MHVAASSNGFSVQQIEHGKIMSFIVKLGASKPLEFHLTLSHTTYERYTAGLIAPVDCVSAAFGFLIARVDPDEIFSDFDLNVMRLYCPNFDRAFPGYLRKISRVAAHDSPRHATAGARAHSVMETATPVSETL